VRPDLIVFAGTNILLAWSFWVILASGQVSLGNAGFMALGAYGASWLTVNSHLPLWPALLLSSTVTAGLGMAIGLAAIRTHGIYLVMLTVGIGQMVQVILVNVSAVGGARGFSGMQGTTVGDVAVAVVVVGLVLWRLSGSPIGRAFQAVKEDPAAAAASGLNVVWVKLISFGCGAFLAALAGGLYAHYILFIRPDQFGFLASTSPALYVILGGADNVFGPILGAALMTLLPEYIRPLQAWKVTAFGCIVLLVIVFRPKGILSRADLARLRLGFKRPSAGLAVDAPAAGTSDAGS